MGHSLLTSTFPGIANARIMSLRALAMSAWLSGGVAAFIQCWDRASRQWVRVSSTGAPPPATAVVTKGDSCGLEASIYLATLHSARELASETLEP